MSTSPSPRPRLGTPEHRQRTSAAWVLYDVLAVLLFAVIGTASHDGVNLGDLGRVALPFLGALLMMWIIPAVRARPWDLWPAGIIVWVGTSAIGLILRWLLGDGVSGAMPIITILALGVLLLAWRPVAAAVVRRRTRTPPQE